MKSFLKWGLIAFVGLGVLGALFGEDEKVRQAKEGSATTTTASTSESTPTEESTPEPTPDPEVSVNYTGPSTVRNDNVILKGTVDPANAHVRVKGQSVKVRRGQWKLPVTLTKHGDNNFRVVATRKGYVKSSTTATVTRELSAAERAVIRQERAAARANRRALESSRASMSNFRPRRAKASRRLKRSMRWITSTSTGTRRLSNRRGATWICRPCPGMR